MTELYDFRGVIYLKTQAFAARSVLDDVKGANICNQVLFR